MSDESLAFTFHNCLGEGGYGEVYLATQHGNIQRQVAVKVLRAEYQEGSDAMNRLRDEGQALAFLAHPSIVAVHEFARVDQRLALVMEYIEGADASYFCTPDTLLSPKVAVRVVCEVAEALGHAYNAPNPKTQRPLQLIHRDVKPANIRLTTDGSVRLLDFGVARTHEMDRKASTMMGDVLLTSGFGAPETLGFGIQSAAGDVFALGVCLYQLLTGEDFYGSADLRVQVNLALDSEDFQAHLDARLQEIEREELRDLLRQMLDYRHEARPEAGDLADQCHELSRSLPGDTIGQWARSYDWPPLPDIKTSLVGRRIGAKGLVLAPSNQLPETKLTPDPKPPPAPPNPPDSAPSLTAPRPPAGGPPAPPQFEGKVSDTLGGPPPRSVSAPLPGVLPSGAPTVTQQRPPPATMSKTPLVLAVAVLLSGMLVFFLGVMLILASVLLR